MLSHLYYCIVMLGYFHIAKFGGDFDPFFPDELTYIEGRTGLLYSKYVYSFFDTLGPLFFRTTNVFIYVVGWVLVFNSDYRKEGLIWSGFSLGAAILGMYWAFFILKESYSVGFGFFLIFGILRNNFAMAFLGGFGLILARPEILFLIAAAESVRIIYNKSKLLFVLLSMVLIWLINLIMSHSLSLPIKLMVASRRFGESNKVFDDAAREASSGSFYKFISSDVFVETVIANFRRTFDPIFDGVSLATPLVAVNFVTLLVALIRFIIYRSANRADLFFAVSIGFLVLTHSVYRYGNIIVFLYIGYIWMLRRMRN